jgi:tRNA pseudouridine38-40 synthase
LRYKLIISYDGTSYAGWQVQANALSIQAIVQTTLETILRTPTDLTGAARTDAGVHALGQTAHFDSERDLSLQELLISLNALLPETIRVLSIHPVASDFHARYSATKKNYTYRLHLDPVINPFTHLYSLHIRGRIDPAKIQEACPYFLGSHDFSAFTNHNQKGSASKGAIRTMHQLNCIEQAGELHLEFQANGFLYKMIRNITGFLIEIGLGKRTKEEIPSLFEHKNRSLAANTTPPHGLFLTSVTY